MGLVIYDGFKGRIADGTIVWPTSDIRTLILNTTAAGAYAPALGTVADLLAVATVVEASGGGYSRMALTGRSVVVDTTANKAYYEGANVVWANALWANAAAAVVYLEGADDAHRYLCSYHDTGFPQVPNGGSFTVAWNGPPSGAVIVAA
jgi:hypothetical protein